MGSSSDVHRGRRDTSTVAMAADSLLSLAIELEGIVEDDCRK